jgi:NIMA (never in mitosis gene a)-related kinase
MITLRPPFRAKDMEGLFNKVCKGQYSRIPDRFSEDLFKIVQYLLQVNSIQRPSCEQILQHPIILKRIEYFKSFGGEDENEDKCLLKTIHMPKNLLFLSDKLPKPNYDKQFKDTNKNEEENKNYRSFNKLASLNNNLANTSNNNDTSKENKENKSCSNHPKRPVKLIPLNNNLNKNIDLNSIIEREKENILMNKENNKQELYILQNNKNKNNILNIKNKSTNNSSNDLIINKKINNLPLNINSINNNKILLKKEDMYYFNVISKQKEDLRKLMLKNNNINRRLNYINNNSQINVSPIKDLNKIFMPNLNNKSVPKKMNNYKIIKNKYYIHSPPYLKGYEKYGKNINKMNYEYGRNYNYDMNNVNVNINNILPKLPRRLSPLKKPM